MMSTCRGSAFLRLALAATATNSISHARTTDARKPAVTAYIPPTTIAATSANLRDPPIMRTPAAHSPETRPTCMPDAARRWAAPDLLKASRVWGSTFLESPRIIPTRRSRSGGSRILAADSLMRRLAAPASRRSGRLLFRPAKPIESFSARPRACTPCCRRIIL
jgi:hypothetical protein